MLQTVSKKFELLARKTNFKKEIIGGIITFFTMIYILPVNATILSDNGNGIPYGGVLLATALAAALGSILVGMFSNLPIGVAPGMGANVFFITTMMKQFHLQWETALAVIIISSLAVTILAGIGFIEQFIKSIPLSIKHTLVIGLGVYLAFIGLKNAGIVVSNTSGLALGDLSQASVILALVGIFLVLALAIIGVKMAVIYTLLAIAFLGLAIGEIIPNHQASGLSAFSDIKFNYNQFHDFSNAFGRGLIAIPQAITNWHIYPPLLALIFLMLSGSTGAIIAIGETTNLKNANGNVRGSKQATLAIGLASLSSGIMGSSTTAGFLESNAGVKFGARTGISAIVVGCLFLLSIPLFPILILLFRNSFVTTPALIFVGLMMMRNIQKINWNDPVVSASSFILLIIMWFTSSILNGLAFGIVAYVIFQTVKGGHREINIYTLVFGLLFLVYIITIPFLII